MNLRKPDQRETLAAEYALGTLRGPARRRFEKLLAHDAALRDEVTFWEERLAQFSDAVRPVVPPPMAWLALQDRLGIERSSPIDEAALRRQRLRSRLRRVMGGFALAASLAGAFLIGQNHPNWPDFERADERPPMFVTMLESPSREVAWLVSLSQDRRQLSVEASDRYAASGPFDIELWCIAPNRGPIALGVLPNRPGATAAFRVPRGVGGEGVTFAITLEQKGGSPTGRPTGPVLTQAVDRGAI